MGRRLDVDDLVGAQEIADRLEVSRPQTVHMWHARHDDFPDPVVELSMGYLWSWHDVERWARRTGRLPK